MKWEGKQVKCVRVTWQVIGAKSYLYLGYIYKIADRRLRTKQSGMYVLPLTFSPRRRVSASLLKIKWIEICHFYYIKGQIGWVGRQNEWMLCIFCILEWTLIHWPLATKTLLQTSQIGKIKTCGYRATRNPDRKLILRKRKVNGSLRANDLIFVPHCVFILTLQN